MSTPDDPDPQKQQQKQKTAQDNVVDLSTSSKRKKARGQVLRERAKGTTMCSSGFHKWQIDHRKQFDVKAGKLITIKRCSRCGQSKTLAT
jgi:hypothetical protein